MMDELVGEADPAALRQNLHQFLFNLLRRIAPGQREAAADAKDVRVDNDSLSLIEANTEDYIGRLASRSGNGDEFGQGLRNLAAEVGNDCFGRALN